MLRAPVPDRMALVSPFSAVPDGVRVRVRVTPGAARNRIDGFHANVDGGLVLKVSVTVPPEKRKANAALIKLLAREWRLPKSSLSVSAGASGRRKAVDIEGDASQLMAKLASWAVERGLMDEN